jgi:hypothetical protein
MHVGIHTRGSHCCYAVCLRLPLRRPPLRPPWLRCVPLAAFFIDVCFFECLVACLAQICEKDTLVLFCSFKRCFHTRMDASACGAHERFVAPKLGTLAARQLCVRSSHHSTYALYKIYCRHVPYIHIFGHRCLVKKVTHGPKPIKTPHYVFVLPIMRFGCNFQS